MKQPVLLLNFFMNSVEVIPVIFWKFLHAVDPVLQLWHPLVRLFPAPYSESNWSKSV